MFVCHLRKVCPHDKRNNSTRQALLKAGERRCIQSRESPEKPLWEEELELALDSCVNASQWARSPARNLRNHVLSRRSADTRYQGEVTFAETHARRIIFPPRNLKAEVPLSFAALQVPHLQSGTGNWRTCPAKLLLDLGFRV